MNLRSLHNVGTLHSMKALPGTFAFSAVCCFCAVLGMAAQETTPAREGSPRPAVVPGEMVEIPAGKFWMGRDRANNRDSLDITPRAKMDDRPANQVYLDAFSIDKYEVTTTEYAK